MPETAIQVTDLTKTFGTFTAVDRINFQVQSGEIMGFLGPNGAGKTTTIKMIMGLMKISSGQIWVKGLDVANQHRQVKRLTGYMSQRFSLYPLLTALENIEFFGGISDLPAAVISQKKQEIREIIPKNILNLKVQDIPPGIRQQIALFVCRLADPEIILLDEPTSGVDPETRRRFWFEIYRLKQAGKTILVTTHNLDEAEYADRILIINHGRLVIAGKPHELLQEWHVNSVEELFRKVVS